jgi:xylulokinase
VDKGGGILADTPLWMDTRAADICARVSEEIGAEEIFGLAGNAFMPQYSTPKVLWFKQHRPDVYRQTHKFLSCNGYIVYKLTGVFTHDGSQGYGYHFFDMRGGSYDGRMAERLGVDLDKIPPLYPCDEVVGAVNSRAAADTGLAEGVPVVAGGLDAACGALGAGVAADGQTQEQGGQAGGMSVCLDRFAAHKKLICGRHVVKDRWLLQGGTVAGGASLRWFKDAFGDSEERRAGPEKTNVFDLLTALAADVPAGSGGLIFLPYLLGERSPLWDPDAKGVFYNVNFDTKKGHFIRAVLEGVAYSLRHNLETAYETGARVSELVSVGGASESPLGTQIKADVTKLAIKVPRSGNATALGAAMLAGIGAGVYRDAADAVGKAAGFGREYAPDAGNFGVYDGNYREYRRLYLNLKDQMKGVSA